MLSDYHFVTRWRVEGSLDEVADILGDPLGLPRWWPAVYLEVHELQKGDERGVGRVIELFTKGWLPYTLRWRFKVTESNRPHGWRLEAQGDFVGRGIWTLKQDGPFVIAEYDWQIHAEKRLLKLLSPGLKPIFRANHLWAMRTGEESLKLELRRRRGEKDVPPPPRPTFRK
jgi:hypothetical protein